ncbi:MAG: hypothetical protein H6740_06050 [Alphaproteobacteria bacterium]|nr:hypothetical protein [Alphaproteobacteria bacterium]
MSRVLLGVLLAGLPAGCIGSSDPVDSETSCEGDPVCPLAVLELEVECGQGSAAFSARSDSPGTVAASQLAVQDGCCPNPSIEAEADLDAGQLRVRYDLTDDVCDCICPLDVRYVLGGVPPGPWILVAPDGSTAPVEVL